MVNTHYSTFYKLNCYQLSAKTFIYQELKYLVANTFSGRQTFKMQCNVIINIVVRYTEAITNPGPQYQSLSDK